MKVRRDGVFPRPIDLKKLRAAVREHVGLARSADADATADAPPPT